MLEYVSIIHNNNSSNETVISSESGEKYAQIKNPLQSKTVLNKNVGGFWWEDNRKLTFSMGESIILNYFKTEATVRS